MVELSWPPIFLFFHTLTLVTLVTVHSIQTAKQSTVI